ncbi:MAG: molybdenum cofactor guanylyltransferase [Gammaproteobacteria bacterium]|nr:molybdenum cofactor guanylyltransferase [Gammaproteobacteria bacterium]MYH90033.1 molybdenum cofactor guanylyltransferase [Gammaproteobacteria bacterium]
MPETNRKITAIILAGGRATRMGGLDKGLLTLGGRTFAEHLVNQVSSQADRVLVNANRNVEEYRKLGCPVIGDTLENFQGPLAGMLAGLGRMETQWLLTLPCDGPFLAEDYGSRMLKAARGDGHALAVATDGDRLQPVYALIHRSLARSLEDFLAAGERKIDRWYARHPFSEVSFADHSGMFINVNTPDELAALEASDDR